jgi:nucleoside-diphosphate-sugar epimerase
MTDSKHSIIVFGGNGFLGKAIIRRLLSEGFSNITSFARSPQDKVLELGVKVVRGDISNYREVLEALSGVKVVFLPAAKAGVWGDWAEFYKANILGPKNIAKAMKELVIKTLVYTSSPSVAYDATNDVEYADETIGYPNEKDYLAYYPKSKAIAEKYLLSLASDSFRVVALRPHLIWGEGDPHLVPKVVDAAKKNKIAIIGSKSSIVDMTHVDNAAHAHILAMNILNDDLNYKTINGKPYFISDDSPVKIWDWINNLLSELNISPINKKVPFKFAFYLGWCIELLFKALSISREPRMTRFIAGQLGHSHYFDISAAKDDLKYSPIVKYSDEFRKCLIDRRGK